MNVTRERRIRITVDRDLTAKDLTEVATHFNRIAPDYATVTFHRYDGGTAITAEWIEDVVRGDPR